MLNVMFLLYRHPLPPTRPLFQSTILESPRHNWQKITDHQDPFTRIIHNYHPFTRLHIDLVSLTIHIKICFFFCKKKQPIFHVKMWNHPMETTNKIWQIWLFRVPWRPLILQPWALGKGTFFHHVFMLGSTREVPRNCRGTCIRPKEDRRVPAWVQWWSTVEMIWNYMNLVWLMSF